jgi:NAD(P)-dependent dehydrogenase (short-subunit alcohol dehydrogenase family)
MPYLSEDSYLATHSDLLSSREIDEVFRKVIEQFGKINVLIHNQNFVARSSIEECDEETFLKVMDWNTKTAFFCTQAAGRYMKEGGRILYLSSIHDEKPTGCAFTYSLSKGAVKMLCRESAVMLGRKGIRSNLIELGAGREDDRIFESDLSNLYKHYEYKIPIDAYISYRDVSNLVSFLCSEESAALNGADIRMDGGHTLNYHGTNKPINQAEGR